MSIIIAVLVHAAFLLVPVKVSYVFVGEGKLYKVQSRLAWLMMVAVFLNIALYNTLYNSMLFVVGSVIWVLMIISILKRDVEKA